MQKSNVSSAGNILVRFPPPVPRDLGGDLRRAVHNFVHGAGDCCAMNTGSREGGVPGWCLSVTIKKVTTTEDWAARIAKFLRERNVSQDAIIEVNVFRGRVDIDLNDLEGSLPNLRRVLFKESFPVSATLWIEIAGKVDDLEPLSARIREITADIGQVSHAYQMPAQATIYIELNDADSLAGVISELADVLGSHASKGKVRLQVSTEQHRSSEPLFKSPAVS